MILANQVRDVLTRAWPYLVLAIFVIAAKYLVIYLFGNATPFWDQWDAEANQLYLPWIEGTYDWKQLFSPHNEHRILTTRLLALALLEIGGRVWNPILQMKVNAFLHVGAICLLVFYLNKAFSAGYRTALFLFAGALFVIPFGWENTLAGFQSQFYMLLLFSFMFLWGMSSYPSFSNPWWLGFLAGVLCPLTMASGALTMLSGGMILTVRRYWFGERREVTISAMVLTFGAALLAIYFTPSVAGHAVLKADSLTGFLEALFKIMAWPASNNGVGLLFIQAPLLWLIGRFLWKRSQVQAGLIFMLATTFWLYGQFASIAYGRVNGAVSSRYLDLFAIGLVLNFASLLVMRASAKPGHIRYMNAAIALWLALVTFGFNNSAPNMAGDLRFKAETGAEQEKNVRAYLCSGDVNQLVNKPSLHIPYPDPIKLKKLLDNQVIRRILPGNISEACSTKSIGLDGERY